MGDEFVSEMNMWYGANELACRWNGFPCFGQTILAQTPLSFYQLPLSHLLEADIQAYSKASQKDKESLDMLERFDWIRQNIKWYDGHAKISPGGYYEERKACGDPNCCDTRMLPLDSPQMPKPSTTNIIHCEELRAMEKLLSDESLETHLASLNLFPEIPVDGDRYREMDYFLPSKALEVTFANRQGLTEKDMINCVSLSQEGFTRRSQETTGKGKAEDPYFSGGLVVFDKLHNETVTRLTETLREICSCGDEGCP